LGLPAPSGLVEFDKPEKYCNPKMYALAFLKIFEILEKNKVRCYWMPPSERPDWNIILENNGSFIEPEQAKVQNPKEFIQACTSKDHLLSTRFLQVPSCDTADGAIHLFLSNQAMDSTRKLEYLESMRFFKDHFLTTHLKVFPASMPIIQEHGQLHSLRLAASKDRSGFYLFAFNPQKGSDTSSNGYDRIIEESGIKHSMFWPISKAAEELNILKVGSGFLKWGNTLIFHEDSFKNSHQLVRILRKKWDVLYPSSMLGSLHIRMIKRSEISLLDLVESHFYEALYFKGKNEIVLFKKQTHKNKIDTFITNFKSEFLDLIFYELEGLPEGLCLSIQKWNLHQEEERIMPSMYRVTHSSNSWLKQWINAYYPEKISGKHFTNWLMLDQLEQAFDEIRKYLFH
jgi:succinylarginine dihydrolase